MRDTRVHRRGATGRFRKPVVVRFMPRRTPNHTDGAEVSSSTVEQHVESSRFIGCTTAFGPLTSCLAFPVLSLSRISLHSHDASEYSRGVVADKNVCIGGSN